MKYRMLPEWAPHKACWVAWPSHEDLWEEALLPVQAEFVALCKAIQYTPPGGSVEALNVLAPTGERLLEARKALQGLTADFYQVGFGDIWLRDTAPLFLSNRTGGRTVGCFEFNGWGGKFDLPFDHEVSTQIASLVSDTRVDFNFVLEGGSIEVDGEGTCLTTEQCLLSPNRNPTLTRTEIEGRLKEALGVEKVLWLKQGLINDHTDGHIDTLARFIAPGEVVCMVPAGERDPNANVLNEIERDLREMTDAKGRKLKVHCIPSPGLVEDEVKKILPASYVNFYISNHSVVVPVYGSPQDGEAVAAITALFPSRKVMGSSAVHLLKGGGAFHCITQQEPIRET
jgi:agmatine deiminase